jgi:hypothetical protein
MTSMSDKDTVVVTAGVAPTPADSEEMATDVKTFYALPSQVDVDPSDNAGNPPLGTTEAEKLAGDYSDDDADYINNLFSPGMDPFVALISGDADEAIDTPIPTTPDPGPACTRIIPGTAPNVALASGYDPVMMLAPDPKRKRFILWATGDFKWGSEKNLSAQAGDFPGSAIVLDLRGHTGAVWVAPASTATATPITVNIASVTE